MMLKCYWVQLGCFSLATPFFPSDVRTSSYATELGVLLSRGTLYTFLGYKLTLLILSRARIFAGIVVAIISSVYKILVVLIRISARTIVTCLCKTETLEVGLFIRSGNTHLTDKILSKLSYLKKKRLDLRETKKMQSIQTILVVLV